MSYPSIISLIPLAGAGWRKDMETENNYTYVVINQMEHKSNGKGSLVCGMCMLCVCTLAFH